MVTVPRDSRSLAEELLELAERDGDRTRLMAAHGALTQTLTFLGQFDQVDKHAERSVALYRPEVDANLWQFYGEIPGLFAHIFRNWVMWIRGYADEAVANSAEVVEVTQDIDDMNATAWALISAAIIRLWTGQQGAARDLAERALIFCTENDVPSFRVIAMQLKGHCLVEDGQQEDGLRLVYEGYEGWEAMGAGVMLLFFRALLAESYERCGQVDHALKEINDAFEHQQHTGDQLWYPELCRIRGTMLLSESDRNASEACNCFREAIEVAQAQGAKSLELRAATALARQFQRQDKRDAGANVLVPIYEWFTEGFDTPDLTEAKALLDQLT